MAIKRVKTFVKGLDKEMNGGVPEGSMVLIAGKPGTMKSSFAYHILYKNALKGKGGVYVTLEQSKKSLVANMENLGMPLDKLETELSVLDLGLIRKKLIELGNQTWLEVFKMYIKNLRKNMDAKLLVIDSLAVLELMSKLTDPREELFHIFHWLKDMDVTAFIVTEMRQDSNEFCRYNEDFLSDGIMHIDMTRTGNTVNLYLAVLKMRQTNHKRGYFPLMLTKDGFEVVAH
jgi:KaiC/GvpD/RAD55 family RecA-like ATPase